MFLQQYTALQYIFNKLHFQLFCREGAITHRVFRWRLAFRSVLAARAGGGSSEREILGPHSISPR